MNRPLRHTDSFADIKRDVRGYATVLAASLALLWLVEVVDLVTGHSLVRRWGLVPRAVSGLPGIVLHPLLHGGVVHLGMNSLGFVTLGGMVILREARDFWVATILGTFVGGLGTWLVGRPSHHVGLSGVIFAYLGYLLTTGWFERRVGSIILSLTAAVLWGSLLFGLSPLQGQVSWEVHLFGLLGGVLTAALRPRWHRAQTTA